MSGEPRKVNESVFLWCTGCSYKNRFDEKRCEVCVVGGVRKYWVPIGVADVRDKK